MGIESGSTNRWKTARERNRLKARFEIHKNVVAMVQRKSENSTVEQFDSEQSNSHYENSKTNASLDEVNILLNYLQAIIKNDVSTFSVTSLARHHQNDDIRQYQLVNGPLPNYATSDIDVTESAMMIDLSAGIPKNGAKTIEEARYVMQMMISTNIPWREEDDNVQQAQPVTLATSKYGRDYITERLIPYMHYLQRHNSNLTLMEYASLLGRHQIVGLLLLGGFNPTRMIMTTDYLDCSVDSYYLSEADDVIRHYKRAGEMASRQVLSYFHCLHINNDEDRNNDFVVGNSVQIPMSIWQYMVRAVVEMRINGATTESSSETICSLCNESRSCNQRSHPLLLNFGSPCFHSFCEPCLWMHFFRHIPCCTDLKSTLVTCPTCNAQFEGFKFCEKSKRNRKREDRSTDDNEEKKEDLMHDSSVATTSSVQLRERRRIQSYAIYMSLPANSNELKLQSKHLNKQKSNSKRRKEKDPIHSSWEEALQPMVDSQLSRDVRSDRLFRAVASSSVQLVIAYLDAGIDVNLQNEYGQTPLYIACWKASTDIVEWLLHFGADPNIFANGGSFCYDVASRSGRVDVLELLSKYDHGPILIGEKCPPPCRDEDNFEVTTLIDKNSDHPGAGACIVDNALSDDQLQFLDLLQQSLPVIDACDEETRGQTESMGSQTSSDKNNYRPSRSYYCDVKHEIQNMLEGCVIAARQSLWRDKNEKFEADLINDASSPTSVFQNIRFLKYERKGGLLPPHVDLCRVDEKSGRRSTHTFILYLTDCEEGGGTALLEHLKTPKVLAVAQPKRGRALFFPHDTPHCGLEVDCVPKVLLRGEVIL